MSLPPAEQNMNIRYSKPARSLAGWIYGALYENARLVPGVDAFEADPLVSS